VNFQVGANTTGENQIKVVIASIGVNLGSLISDTGDAALSAIVSLDEAIDAINTNRASLGAIQNRFEGVLSQLAAANENTTAARSRIMDADYADETAKLARAQVLQQAGVAMLSQANALPQNVLSLLR